MAKLFPSLEKIVSSRQLPTQGELHLLKALIEQFPEEEVEVYFQPYFNGDRPDIVLVCKSLGVVVVEVKDWNLNSYTVDKKNRWRLASDSAVSILSPFRQAFAYKENFFAIHVNGLLEKKIKNKDFYKTINVFVYLHNADAVKLNQFYSPALDEIHRDDELNTERFKSGKIDHPAYLKNADYLQLCRDRIDRDKSRHCVTRENIRKIAFPRSGYANLFSESDYQNFLRYLQPPFHALNEGIHIDYSPRQLALVESSSGFSKIKGVAGSGKTTIMAKRAVNAHKRHDDRVLILTFNLTLRMYIRDRISEVRENFSWGFFDIINYHKFINQALSAAGVEVEIPSEIRNNNAKISDYLDKKYYSNVDVFDHTEVGTKYMTIFIDEIQDYRPEWIRIIRKYFLESSGEMVLFGDEKQNIYARDLAEDKCARTPNGFGRWIDLKQSFRQRMDSPILQLAKDFQASFFADRYTLDFTEEFQPSLTGLGAGRYVALEQYSPAFLVECIFNVSQLEHLHPNDIVVLGSRIPLLQEIDYLIRCGDHVQERTLTTFEKKEFKGSPQDLKRARDRKKYGFNLNSGVLKLATTHSFKGYESPTVFLIVDDDDSPELVYVGLTRAKLNLIVCSSSSSRFADFFRTRLTLLDFNVSGPKPK